MGIELKLNDRVEGVWKRRTLSGVVVETGPVLIRIRTDEGLTLTVCPPFIDGLRVNGLRVNGQAAEAAKAKPTRAATKTNPVTARCRVCHGAIPPRDAAAKRRRTTYCSDLCALVGEREYYANWSEKNRPPKTNRRTKSKRRRIHAKAP